MEYLQNGMDLAEYSMNSSLSCIKSTNILANSLLFPGSLAKSSYQTTYNSENYESHLLYIPYGKRYIPAILVLADENMGSLFCIHLHGNGCDVGQIVKCAIREAQSFNSHYLIVEYPRFGIMNGFVSEAAVDDITTVVYNYVTEYLKVPTSRIVLIGRSIGTGPACALASKLEIQGKRPAAVILQSPFCSLKDAAFDLVGTISLALLERW